MQTSRDAHAGEPLARILAAIKAANEAALAPSHACLLAVSKTQPAAAIRALANLGQTAFGENYVQEAMAKGAQLADLSLEWHLIGHLQSNKCRLAANAFDWVQSIDRPSLIEALNAGRDPLRSPLNVLIQVNVDDEASKSGCRPDEIERLASAIAQSPRLQLRGLMVIPTPHSDMALRHQAFVRSRALFDQLAALHPGVDTLSMGMSEDFESAIHAGATMVRIGSALFGARIDATDATAI